MSGSRHKLNRKQIKGLSAPGRYGDGGGLYLYISKTGAKSWVYRYSIFDKRRDMGLGPLTKRNHIDKARENAEAARALVNSGVDPIVDRQDLYETKREEIEAELNFGDVIEKFFESKDLVGYFRTEQTRRRWYFCLSTHAKALHHQKLEDIKTRHVYDTLIPIWKTKTETASRTRLYMESVFAWAATMGLMSGPNPAVWRGNLDQLLPPKERVSPSKNHPALAWQEIPKLMAQLREMETPASFLTEFIILTASRSGEARGAVWEEIDLEKNVWAITAERMKMRRPHIVPLTTSTLRLLETVQGLHSEVVFCNPSNSRPFSYNAPMVALRKLGYEDITVHGFRSSFKTWALEATNFPTQAVEFALAHETKNTVERAYIRGNKMLDKRRDLMKAWDEFCMGTASS